MEYCLKQISPCAGDPLIIQLDSNTKEIGRSAIPHLAQYTQVSRRHALVSKVNHEWVIEDLNSMNGVFVEHRQIGKGKHKLNVGDTIGFGVSNVTESSGFVCIFIPSLKKIKNEPVEVVTLSDDEKDFENLLSSNVNDLDIDHRNIAVSNSATSNVIPSPIFSPLSNVSKVKNNSTSSNIVSSPIFSSSSNDSATLNNLSSLELLSSSNVSTSTKNGVFSNNLSSFKRVSLPEENTVKSNSTSSNISSSSSHESTLKPSKVTPNITCSSSLSCSLPDKSTIKSKNDGSITNTTLLSDESYIKNSSAISKNICSSKLSSSSDVSTVKHNCAIFSKPSSSTNERAFATNSATFNNLSSSVPSSSTNENAFQTNSATFRNLSSSKLLSSSNENALQTNSATSNISFSSKLLTTSNKNTLKTIPNELSKDDPKLFRDCVVPLVKCDSSNFDWPDDVKKIAKSLKRINSNSIEKETSKKQKNDSSDKKSEDFQINNNKNNFSGTRKRLMNPETNEITSSKKAANSLLQDAALKPVEKHPPNIFEDENMLSDDEDNFGYSQVEEVICISDDDSYLDFNASQPIKLEPSDEEDDFRALDELPDENDLEIAYDSGANSESIETIRNFMEASEISSVRVKVEKIDDSNSNLIDPLETVFHNNLNSKSNKLPETALINISESNLSDHETVFNKELPSFNSVEETESDNSEEFNVLFASNKHFYYQKKTKERKIEETESASLIDKFLNKKKPQLNSKIKLTEPKPMERRPRQRRGREEWFEPTLEKAKKVVNTLDNDHKIDVSVVSNRKNKKKDIPVHSSSDKKLRLSAGKALSKPKDQIKEKLKMIGIKNLQQAASNAPPVFKKPAPTVKKRNDNFGSRSQFLTTLPSEVAIKPNTSKDANKNLKNKSLGNKTSDNSPSSLNLRSKANVSVSRDVSPSTSQSGVAKISPVLKVTANNVNNSNTKMLCKNSTPVASSNIRSPSTSATTSLPKKTVSFTTPPATVFKEQSALKNHPTDPRFNRKPLDPRKKYENHPHDKNVGLVPKWSQNKSINETTSIVSDSSISSKEKDKNANRQTSIASCSNSSGSSRYPTSLNISHGTILEKIVGLNVKWIREQKNQSSPPPYVSKGAIDLPLHFETYEQYLSVFTPMLMLEMWEEICKEAQPILENKNYNKFYFTVKSHNIENGFSTYVCESMINSNSPKPMDGTLVILEIKEKTRLHPILGYINNHRFSNALRAEERTVWNQVDKYWTEGAYAWKFSVLTKVRDLSPILEHIMKGNVIFSIKNKLRLADALSSFRGSPLCKYILRPDKKVCSVNYPAATHSREYSSAQKVVIEGISNELSKPRQETKMILLQGPPGTGKTHTIVGLLESLIFSNPSSRKKILVVAPSNAAIDEIGSRLIDLNEKISYKKSEIKFVRIGLDRSMNTKMKPYSLDEKADVFYKEESRKSKKYKLLELEKKEREIKKLKEEIDKYPSYPKKQTIDNLQLQCRKIREEMANERFDYRIRQIKMNILKDSNVILSTLGSCCQSVMVSAFEKNFISFSACIIDEATQCTEIEILQPLTFHINRLILVGDHNQLPATVSSQLALRKNFDRSMFERFYIYFSSGKTQNPVFMLTEQFRMHSEICKFPSSFFYDGKLMTAPDNDIRYKQFPVKPYIVFDILDSQETNCLSSKTNYNEARAIASICGELIYLESNATIGIITPYQAQVNLYKDVLYHNPGYKNIEINTVDSFQGREKDIIIVSCVRANSSSGGIGFLSCRKRLNVAITRARHCLIICVHARTLEIFDYWRDLINDARTRHLLATVPTCEDMSQIFHDTLIKKQL